MRVLLAEGSVSRTAALTALFKAEGLIVEHTDSGDDVLALLRRYAFDIVVLNRDLTDTELAKLISRMRAAGHHTPVLALLGSANSDQRLAVLSAGADDVVDQDTNRAELLARMRAIQRRSRGFSQPVIRCGRVALDQGRQQAMIEDNLLRLTQKEFAVLQLLMMRRNVVMTKEVILSNLYGGMDEPEIKIIDVFICKIRSKLAKAGVRNLIQTVWGRGYVVRDVPGGDENNPIPHVPQPIETSPRELASA